MKVHNVARRKRFAVSLATTAAVALTGIMPTAAFAVDRRQDEGGIRLCTVEEQAYIKNVMSGEGATKDSSSEDSSGAPSGEAKAWLKEGTEEYKRAKQIYDFFTEKIGTSGAFAAGVLANVEQESAGTFDPKISEGGGRFPLDHSTDPDFGGPGGGAYQFTPYQKYVTSPQFVKGGWTLDAESEFVWMTEFQTNAITTYMKNAPNLYGIESPFTRAYTAIPNPKTGKTEKVILDPDALVTTLDPVAASKGFQVGYERPAVYHPEREPSAVQANKVFNKDNFEGDAEKLKNALPAGGILTLENAAHTIGAALSGALSPKDSKGEISTLFVSPCRLPNGDVILDLRDARDYAARQCGVNNNGTRKGNRGGTSSSAGLSEGNAYEKMPNKEKLLEDADHLAKAVSEEFPEIEVIGGWRAVGGAADDHVEGRAIDIMTPLGSYEETGELGDEINAWIWAHADEFNLDYTIWEQRFYQEPSNTDSPKPANTMEDRGSITENHYDHVHASVLKEGQTRNNPGHEGDSGRSSKSGKRGGLNVHCGATSGGSGKSVGANEYGVALPAEGVFFSPYGWIADQGRSHNGIDISDPAGSPIYAAADGKVIDSGPAQGYGNWIRIEHEDGLVTTYGHMKASGLHVKVGDTVSAGDHIADMGSEGYSTGPHLHFGVYEDASNTSDKEIDPEAWLRANGYDDFPERGGRVTISDDNKGR